MKAGTGLAAVVVVERPGRARAPVTRGRAARMGGHARSRVLATLPARSGASVAGGVQRFQSRPDLLAPQVVIDRPASGPLGGLVVTDSHRGASQSGPLIVDQTGRIIWFEPMAASPSAPQCAFNVRVQSLAGRPVLSWFQGVVVGGHGVGYGQGVYQVVDTRYAPVARIAAQNGYQADLHEFLLTPEGTALFTCYGRALTHVRRGGASFAVTYLFGVVQEVDIATGKLLFEWRSDHHIPLSDSYRRPVLRPGWLWDYLHVNSITIDPSDGNLIISGRNTCACYKINRRSGRVIWRLGGKRGQFRMGRGTRFAFQHDVEAHPGGLLSVFDNEGGPPREARQSRALLLDLDERHRRVRLRQAIHHHPPVYSDALGSVQPLSGGVFVGWGRASYFTSYTPSGSVAFEGHLMPKVSSYRAFLSPWEAAPRTPPALAITRSGAGATVYASWNGATALAQWVVLGGASASALAPLGVAPVAGFETAITLASAPAYVSVQACDGAGKVLSASPAKAV